MSTQQSSTVRSSTITNTGLSCYFHTDLSDKAPNEDYFLYFAGKQYKLIEHTPQSRSIAKQLTPSIAKLNDNQLTHYTEEPIEVAHGKVIRYSIRHRNTTGIVPGDNGIHHVGILVTPPAPAIAADQPMILAQHIDYVATAISLLFHHADLMVSDPTIAAYVMEHMDQEKAPDNYMLIQVLAGKMRLAGPPNTNSGWANYQNFDAGKYGTKQSLVPTNDTIGNAGPAMTAIQNTTKNDTRLQDKKWTIDNGTSVQSAQSNISERNTIQTAAGDNWTAALANTNATYGLQTTISVKDSSKRQVHVKMQNTYVRALAAYIQFIDADGNPMNTPGWQPDDGGIAASITTTLDLNYDNMRFIGYISPIDTIMAVPDYALPGELDVDLTFPPTAVSAKIYGCGLGTGDNQYPKAVVIGGVATGLLNFAMPAFFLGVGVGIQTWKPAYDITKNPKFIAVAIGLGVSYFGSDFIYNGAVNKKMDWNAFSSLGQILFDKSAESLLEWAEKKIIQGEIEDEIPFAGWVMIAINIATDLAQMAETIVEVATSPWMIANSISTTITSTLTIHPDPRHNKFPVGPAGSTPTYVARMIYKNQNRPSISSQPVTLNPANYPATVSASFVNTLGGKVKFEVDFYLDNWLAGKATTAELENDEPDTANITMYLFQNPIPLDSKSIYKHTAILEFNAGQYGWITNATPPSGTLANANTSQIGNAISEWMGLSLNQRYGMIGLSYKAASLGIVDCTNQSDGQLYAFQNINIPGGPMNALKFPSCAFTGLSQLVYDIYPPRFKMDGNNFVFDSQGNPIPDPASVDLGNYYVDPRKANNSQDTDGGYHLRIVILDNTTPFNMNPNQNSFGRFPYFPDSLTLHPSGHVIGVNKTYCKMMIANIPTGTGLADNNIPLARAFAGKALNFNGSGGRTGLLFTPVAITCSYDGTVLVLEQLNSQGFNAARIQAFDLNGNPVSCFSNSGQATAILNIPTNVTYLDIAAVGDNFSTFIYVLYYANTGRNPGDYSMSIYQYGKNAPKGNLLVTTPNIPAAHINVDMWHTLYTLNYQMVEDSSGHDDGIVVSNTGGGIKGVRTVPSVSEWVPPLPTT